MPGFLGGLSQGLEQGGFGDAIAAFIRSKQQEKVAAAVGNTMTGGAPPQAGPGPASPHPAAALAAIGGGGPQPAPFKPGVPPAPGQPDPLAPLPPAPPPGAPTGAPGAEAPTGMSVNPAFADPIKEGQSLIQNLWKSTKAANPKADPRTIMKAVEYQIDEVKGVAPITKSAMQGQLMMLKENMRAQEFDQKELRLWKEHSDKLALAYKSDNWKSAVAEENARFRGEMVGVAKDRANVYADSVEYQHEDRQSAETGRDTRASQTDSTRRYVADTGNKTREEISADRSDDSTYRTDQGVRGAQIRSGQEPDPAPPRPRAGAGRGGPKTVNGPDDIRKLPSGTKWVSADGKRHGIAP